MIVIFDTNVWISDLALTSSRGSAVRFFLREQQAIIGLPEVVKLETEYHLRTILSDHIEGIRSSHRQILAVFGRLKEVVLPTDEEVETLISKVFSNLGVKIQEYPFTLESARASLIRTVRKLPPSDKSQQFKDGVLWQDCLNILKTQSVFLVTEDRAFYKNHETKLGLADELSKDLFGMQNDFKIFPSLRDLLSQIGTGVKIDPSSFISAYMNFHGDKVKSMANKNSFILSTQAEANLDVFVTEKPSFLYFTFSIELTCEDTTSEGRTGGKIIARGEGTYDAEEKRFTEIADRGEQLVYNLPDGTQKMLENYVLLVGSAVIGHRTVEHSIRHKV
jgi:hypothetical protein